MKSTSSYVSPRLLALSQAVITIAEWWNSLVKCFSVSKPLLRSLNRKNCVQVIPMNRLSWYRYFERRPKMFWSDTCDKLKDSISKFQFEFVRTLAKSFALRSPNSETFAEYCTLTKSWWTSADIGEQGFLPADMSALFLDYRALCCTVEIDCTSSELHAMFPKSIV